MPGPWTGCTKKPGNSIAVFIEHGEAGPLDELRIGFASGEERRAHRALPRRRLVPVQHQDRDARMPMPRTRFGARPVTASKRSFRSSPWRISPSVKSHQVLGRRKRCSATQAKRGRGGLTTSPPDSGRMVVPAARGRDGCGSSSDRNRVPTSLPLSGSESVIDKFVLSQRVTSTSARVSVTQRTGQCHSSHGSVSLIAACAHAATLAAGAAASGARVPAEPRRQRPMP